ncbi:peptidoglycan-binding protein, partial [Patescibacteria group bacterium]
MKNLFFVFIVFSLVVPASLMAETVSVPSVGAISSVSNTTKLFPSNMKKGMTSDAIKDLQNVLKSDPSVYPEGLVTGYYGSLTEGAIKRLQNKYSIPVTGILDDATQSIIFPPKIELKILVPNGGETWDKSQMHSIFWEAKTSPVVLNGKKVIQGNSSGESVVMEMIPFYHRASLDLISDREACAHTTGPGSPTEEICILASPRVYHIATVNLYDSQYNWSIPDKIPAGSNYRVRISVGSNVPCL